MLTGYMNPQPDSSWSFNLTLKSSECRGKTELFIIYPCMRAQEHKNQYAHIMHSLLLGLKSLSDLLMFLETTISDLLVY